MSGLTLLAIQSYTEILGSAATFEKYTLKPGKENFTIYREARTFIIVLYHETTTLCCNSYSILYAYVSRGGGTFKYTNS